MNAMYFNKFSVRVFPGREVQGSYVMVPHGAIFKLNLKNDLDRQACDAHVLVNGLDCGTFRIGPNQSLVLERPLHDAGQFTFYELGTPEFYQANGHLVTADNNGLVSVTFTPEKLRRPVAWTKTLTTGNVSQPYGGDAVYRAQQRGSYTPQQLSGDPVASASAGSYPEVSFSAALPTVPESSRAGTVGLSGHSNQTFRTVEPLDYDYTGQTTLNLRLISDHDDTPRPLGPISTPVPPPLNR
jgi:hypothetical protein